MIGMTGIKVDLSGQYAFITGGSRGIGRAISTLLARAGADVAINYFRNRKAAEEVKTQVEAQGRQALLLKGNVAVEEDVHAMTDMIREAFPKLDILVANAASGVLRPVLQLTKKHWDWTMNINATSLIHLLKHTRDMMPSGSRIVAVSSLGAYRAIPNYAAVGASKAALESLIRHLALELGPSGIRVNCASAGTVDTDALHHFPNREELLADSLRRTPLGRLTTPLDVAYLVLFLVSPWAEQVHGQTIIVDGGYSIIA